jgi:hypothetical protein
MYRQSTCWRLAEFLSSGRQPGHWRGVSWVLIHANGAPMERELTPVEARSGVVSGRILTILVVSSVGAIAAMAIAWLFLFPR